MHELAIAQKIISTIEDEAKKRGYRSITRVNLTIGKMTGFKKLELKTCLSAYKKLKIFKKTKFEIKEVPVHLKCAACGNIWTDSRFDDAHFAHEIAHSPILYSPLPCPKCGNKDAIIASGQEISLTAIEGE